MVLNDLFFKISKLLNKNKDKDVSAMMIQDNDSIIIIAPSRSYIFYNNISVEPKEFKMLENEGKILDLLKLC